MNLVPHTFPQRLSPDVLSAPSSQESSPKQHLQHEAVSQLQSPVGFSDNKESSTMNVVEAQLEQKQLNSVKDYLTCSSFFLCSTDTLD